MVLRVVTGTGTGPTALAAYDAALCAAGVGNYNLVRLSSVVPAGAELRRLDAAPDLGPVGAELRVVEARATAGPGELAAAALGWARRPDGSGLFYEEGATVDGGAESGGDRDGEPVAGSEGAREGRTDGGVGRTPDGSATAATEEAPGTAGDSLAAHEATVADRVGTGLRAGVDRRGWSTDESTVVTSAVDADSTAERYAGAVVLATYGRARSLERTAGPADGVAPD